MTYPATTGGRLDSQEVRIAVRAVERVVTNWLAQGALLKGRKAAPGSATPP